MKDIIHNMIDLWLVFGGGFVAAINLSILCPLNAPYPASWLELWIALAVTTCGIFMNLKRNWRNGNGY